MKNQNYEIKIITDKEYNKNPENYPKIVSADKNDEKRIGCDICKKDKPTEKFFGYCGSILWICEMCYNKLIEI